MPCRRRARVPKPELVRCSHGIPLAYREHLLHMRVAADLAYLERPVLSEDVRILARTALFVLAGLRR